MELAKFCKILRFEINSIFSIYSINSIFNRYLKIQFSTEPKYFKKESTRIANSVQCHNLLSGNKMFSKMSIFSLDLILKRRVVPMFPCVVTLCYSARPLLGKILSTTEQSTNLMCMQFAIWKTYQLGFHFTLSVLLRSMFGKHINLVFIIHCLFFRGQFLHFIQSTCN